LKSLENDDLRKEFNRLKQRFTDIIYDNNKEIDRLRYEKEKKTGEMELLVKRSNDEILLLEKKIALLKAELYNIMEKRLDEENILIMMMQKYLDSNKEVKDQVTKVKYSQVILKSYEKLSEGVKLDNWKHVEIREDFRKYYEDHFKY